MSRRDQFRKPKSIFHPAHRKGQQGFLLSKTPLSMKPNANIASCPVAPRLATGTLATLRELPRPVWILYAGTFLNKFGTFVIPFLALYMTRMGFSMTQAGLAIGAYGVGLLAASA